MNEQQIIKECITGDFTNFAELVKNSIPAAYALAFRLMGRNDEAEDIVQEAMVKVWQKIGKMKDSEAYRSWLCRIVINLCYDHLRQRKLKMEAGADEKTWKLLSDRISSGNSVPLENEEIAMVIETLTASLSPKQKVVFVLSETEGLSPDEIASETGMGKQTIKANLHYARKKIGEMVRKYL